MGVRDRRTAVRTLRGAPVVLGLCLLFGYSEPAKVENVVDHFTAEPCRGVPLPATGLAFSSPATQDPVPSDPHSSARWYVDGRVTVQDLSQFYRRINYELGAVQTGIAPVPRVLMAKMPSDLQDIRDVDSRKAVFIATVLPMALQANEAILQTRQVVTAASKCLRSNGGLARATRQWLEALHGRYGTEGDIGELLERLDVVPPSIILAQAAIESHWGMSPFAKKGNVLFGERTHSNAGGMVADQAGADASIGGRGFVTLLESIEAYVFNLNVSYAYASFRDIRAKFRHKGLPLDGIELSRGLEHYSRRGSHYGVDIENIIADNELQAFDKAELERIDGEGLARTVRLRDSRFGI